MAEDNDDKPIDPKAHQALADAHERLKRDAQADRDALKQLRLDLDAEKAAREEAAEKIAEKDKDVEGLRAQLEAKHARELKALTDRAEKAEGQVRRLVIENGLDAQLDAAGVAPPLKKAAKALLRDQVELKDENGEPLALMGGVALADGIKTWASSDEGKHFILDGNSGGGAPGGKTGAGGKNPWKVGSADFSLTEQDRIAAQDPALAGRLKAEAGA